jgi:hypothetical protein
LVSEVEAIESSLGPNLSNLPTSPFVINGPFNFAAQSPGGSLIVGANNITLSPVPPGVSGTDANHYVSISGGTGAAEAALIIGGGAVGGAPSGTLIIQCANAHSGAWTIKSATGGIQEAVCSLPAAGGQVIVNSSVTLSANVGPCGKTSVVITKFAGITIAGAFTVLGQSSAGDGRPEDFSFVASNSTYGTSGWYIAGTSPTWLTTRSPAYTLIEANVNNYQFQHLNPVQFCSSGVTGAVNVPAGANTSNSNASGVNGLCSTSSVDTTAVGVSAYANTLVAGASAWGANFAVSNQDAPGLFTGAHAQSLIGLELDITCVGGGAAGATGLQIQGVGSTQPAGSNAIQIVASGGTKWGAGVSFYTASSSAALDINPLNSGNNSGCQPIMLRSSGSTGVQSQSYIATDAIGTIMLTGGNGTPTGGVQLSDGAGNILLKLVPGSSQLSPLPVYADNTAAKAAGLLPSMLYKTATGQVMQVF